MEETTEIDVYTLTTEELKGKGKKRAKASGVRKSKGKSKRKAEESQETTVDGENLRDFTEDRDCPRVTVSMFDYSVENHFKAMDMISKLCGEAVDEDFNASEVERLSSTTTFLREWRHYYYNPRIIRFTCETGSPQGKDVVNGINLPQFSAATVPKMERLSGDPTFQKSSKDFVLYAGGPVWALDWCPRVHQSSNCHIKCEFLAVASHPPESSYHKIGAPLTGRGVVQIWCLLNVSANEEEAPPPMNKPRGRPKKKEVVKDKSSQPKRPRGRPRKKAIKESLDDLDSDSQFVPALSVQFPEDSSGFLAVSGVVRNTHEHALVKDSDTDAGLETETREGFSLGLSACKSGLTTPMQRRRMKENSTAGSYDDGICPPSSTQNEDNELFVTVVQAHNSCGQDPDASCQKVANIGSLEISTTSSHLPTDVALPRLVLCLAHNGKVAWDVKWKPTNDYDLECKHRMGYLAVLLGNGSLEVWEVPLPSTVKVLYSSCRKEGTDPRFVKLEPVFRCSKLKCGNRQSIPLTVEWSPSSPHDLILAGCHDGTVALWKFSTKGSAQDTRPLLCFSADTVPIRALCWAPNESDSESANVIVTAGHGGLKFWDLRDPYRPLWDLNPVRRVIYSLDWLPDPRCVIISFDDGTLRILSLVKAAYDVPVTGKPFVGTQQQGLHSYFCSSFTIWSVQVSRLTGMAAYCSADGTVLRFQLTTKSVEKDPLRNRAPHFLCGSLTEEDSALTVNTPLPNSPFPMKKSLNEWGDTPRSMRGFLSDLNQVKRTKDQTSNDRSALAFCYGDEPGKDFGTRKTRTAPKSKSTPKRKMSNKRKTDLDEALSSGEELENIQKGETEKRERGNEIEAFPPKIVAMHKVRWNMNKGSERWLCYGGAAGIIRCQEIDPTCVDKRSLVKR